MEFEQRLVQSMASRREIKNRERPEDMTDCSFHPETNWAYYTQPDENGEQHEYPKRLVRMDYYSEQRHVNRLYTDAMRRAQKDRQRDRYYDLGSRLGDVLHPMLEDRSKLSFAKLVKKG